MTLKKVLPKAIVAGLALSSLTIAYAWFVASMDLGLSGKLAAVADKPHLHARMVTELGGGCKAAERLLAYVGESVGPSPERNTAIILLGLCGESGVAGLKELSRSTDTSTRCAVAKALGRAKDNVDTRASVLAVLLGDKEGSVRRWAAGGLGDLGEAATLRGHWLVESLGDENDQVREASAMALGRVYAGAGDKCPEEVIDRLMCALSDTSFAVEAAAASSLGVIGRCDQESLVRLLERLNGSSRLARIQVAKALLLMGPARGWGRFRLSRLLIVEKFRRGYEERSSAPEFTFADPAALQHLKRASRSSEYPVRLAVALYVSYCSQPLPDEVHVLEGLLGDEVADIRWAAALSAGSLGRRAAGLTEALNRALRDSDTHVRQAAAKALEKIKKAQQEKQAKDKQPAEAPVK